MVYTQIGSVNIECSETSKHERKQRSKSNVVYHKCCFIYDIEQKLRRKNCDSVGKKACCAKSLSSCFKTSVGT